MKKVTAIARQVAQQDIVTVQTSGVDTQEFITTLKPLMQRVNASLQPCAAGLSVRLAQGQSKAFLGSLSLLLSSLGFQVRTA